MKSHIINLNATVLEALDRINALSGSAMILFAVDADGIMRGTLSDGDIRRGLLRGVPLSGKVSEVMNSGFKALLADKIDVAALREYRRARLVLIPILDADGHIVDIVDTTRTATRLPLRAILMAGGKGERLRPLTLKTPKPLLKIGNKPIIDYNIEALARVDVTDITVTINYLAEEIEMHFSHPVAGINVRCLREPYAMGTIGSAALAVSPEPGATIVMNSDLLTSISFEDMYLTHAEEDAAITIAAIPYNVSVPYAILSTDGNSVVALQEKPSYSYYANAGIYIINNNLLRELPTDCRTDATDLIESAIARGLKVVYHPISGTWIDIGSPIDFKHAQELMRHHIETERNS